jgi:hypothetical protein
MNVTLIADTFIMSVCLCIYIYTLVHWHNRTQCSCFTAYPEFVSSSIWKSDWELEFVWQLPEWAGRHEERWRPCKKCKGSAVNVEVQESLSVCRLPTNCCEQSYWSPSSLLAGLPAINSALSSFSERPDHKLYSPKLRSIVNSVIYRGFLNNKTI